MKYHIQKFGFFGVVSAMLVVGIGCGWEKPLSRSATAPIIIPPAPVSEVKEKTVVLPVENYAENRTLKRFGTLVHDRFNGYHAGDDVEVSDKTKEIPVQAIADGTVRVVRRVSGYGGLIIIEHVIGKRHIHALYGHIALNSTTLKVGDNVIKGGFLANLGDDTSVETDGERKHLHFGLYEANEIRLSGYVVKKSDLERWINPQTFFEQHGIL